MESGFVGGLYNSSEMEQRECYHGKVASAYANTAKTAATKTRAANVELVLTSLDKRTWLISFTTEIPRLLESVLRERDIRKWNGYSTSSY